MRMRAEYPALCICLGLLLGCSSDPTGPEPGDSFTLKPGERVTLPDAETRVRFQGVSEDSRCPLRAQCVWAGDGAAVFEIAPLDGDAMEHTLHTNEGPTGVVLGRYELELLELDPYPEVPGGIAPDDYRATLVLQERLE